MTRYILFLICFLLSFAGGYATASEELGTLVVSYQTGPKGERLSRVRILLIDEVQQEHMFPKGDSFIEDEEKLKRLVAIEELAPGNYTIKFLVPNNDGLFEEVPDKHITIEPGESLKIDQEIKPRYVSLKAMTTFLPKDKIPTTHPILTLRDPEGNVVARSTSGKMISHFLLPNTYTLSFEPLPGYVTPDPITFPALPGRTVGVLTGTYRWQEGQGEIAMANPANPIIIRQVNGQLTVTTNMPQAHWTLLKNNQAVYFGQGSVVNYQAMEGDNYRITAEEIEGYSVRVNPPYPFSLYASQTMRADIFYERTYGTLAVEAQFPDGETVIIKTTRMKNRNFKTFTTVARGGKIFWLSPQIPSGSYEISYVLPPNYEPIPPETVFIHPGERRRLRPVLFPIGLLRLHSNIPEAIYILKSITDGSVWQGEGRDYLFKGLPGGIYKLSLTSKNPDYFIPPEPLQFTLTGLDNKDITLSFKIGGMVVVRSNMDKNAILIEGISDPKFTLKDKISDQKKAYTLPEGRYRISLSPLHDEAYTTISVQPPEPVEFTVNPMTTQTLELQYSVGQKEARPTTSTLSVATNTSFASFALIRDEEEKDTNIGTYSGKNNRINLPPGKYQLLFADVTNYKTPEPLNITISQGRNESVQADYKFAQEVLPVAEGKAIVGPATSPNAPVVNISAFSIGTFEITNAQYANWLNKAQKNGSVVYVEEADNEGQVVDMQGRLLCKTFKADPFSQITTQRTKYETVSFGPLPGKEQYPVINVSWYGAMAYCADNNCRLPTEAEWEKAAGNAKEAPEDALRKFIYGFSRDAIDRTWANYKATDRPIQYFQVLTTPVGFYNGSNPIPLTGGETRQLRTNLAQSPYGAFDMSGNVWEWVSDWYSDDYLGQIVQKDPQGPRTGTKKVVKGGCYDSLAEGVRVTERLGLDPQHVDAFTGFRIAQ